MSKPELGERGGRKKVIMGKYFSDSEMPELISITLKIRSAQFSRSEKLAILQVLDLLIHADHKANEKEMKWLEIIIDKFDLPFEDIHVAVNQDGVKGMMELKSMNSNQKDIFKQLIVKMVTIDGNVVPKQVEILSMVCNIVGIKI